MRPQPSTPPDVTRRDDPGLITETRRYKVITPLFGGGVTPGEADPVTVVRATEVRGHLRFWWRATRGGQFDGDLAAMKHSEEQIWGSPGASDRAGPSPVSIFISEWVQGQELRQTTVKKKGEAVLVDVADPSSPYSYVAFPLRKDGNKHAGCLRENVQFWLELTYPEHVKDTSGHWIDIRPDIEAAIWAWETFGGIGARTRRGFGALQLDEVNGIAVRRPDASQIRGEIAFQLTTHVVDGTWHDSVPHLTKQPDMRVLKYEPGYTEVDVWLDLVSALKEFRQAPKGRREGTKESNWRPGRSFWPEPEAIRKRTGQRLPKHQVMEPAIDRFPRAQFGLPIIFQFKDSDKSFPSNPHRDPRDTTLQGVRHERLASPLIIRPLACANNEVVGLVAILDAPTQPPGGLLLKDSPSNPGDTPIVSQLSSKSEANAIKPLRDVGGETDVLVAFLKSL